MKKVLIIQESLRGGGAERVLKNILQYIDYTKYEVDLVLIEKDGVYLDKINKKVNIKGIYPTLNLSSRFLFKVNRKIRNNYVKYFSKFIYKMFMNNDYDVEIAFLEGPCTHLLSKSTNKKSKKIGWVHIDLNKFRRMSFEEEAKCYKKLDKVVCVSNDSKRVFLQLYPQYKDKVEVLYNLIDVDEINILAKEPICYDFNLPTVVSVGRLAAQKRFDILIKAHKMLIDEGINHKLLILGTGPKEEELKELIKSLKVEDTVDLHGFTNNPYPYIKNSTVYAMSSDFEGLPLVICEALVLGKSIVSTNCTGPSELLEYGNYGIIVPCGDIVELKNGIRELLINPDKRANLEEKSLERSKIFDKEKVMRELDKLIIGEV